MSRRDTIIIAVLVNAALLVVLFISAITSKEDVKTDNQIAKDLIEEVSIDAKELFSSNEKPQDDAKAQIQSELNEFVALTEEKPLDANHEEVVHKLPQIVKEEQVIVDPAVAKAEPVNNKDGFEVVVKKGDTLDKIAKENGISTADIKKINRLQNNFLKIGQKIIIAKTEKSVLKNEKQSTKNEKATSLNEEYYVVKVGDNPYTIAMKHHIKPNELLKLNNLDEKKARKLKPGDKLRIR